MQALYTSSSSTAAAVAASTTPSTYAPLYLSTTLSDAAFDIEELEAVCLDRLNLLKAVSSARTSFTLSKKSHTTLLDSIKSAVTTAEVNLGFTVPTQPGELRERRIWKDEASHFLLRLALCRNIDQRNWLLQTEHDLFSARLQGDATSNALSTLQRFNAPHIHPITDAEHAQFDRMFERVARAAYASSQRTMLPSYKVAFEHVPMLVRQRRVFLRSGFAYITEKNVKELIASHFRTRLSHAMSQAAKAVVMAEKDPRVAAILKSIQQHFAADETKPGFDPNKQIETISLSELTVSETCMPLCMANMYQKLKQNHHLRYSARLQLGVFLKGCGLTLEESIAFWSTQFTKSNLISSEQFQKQYAYNIRHHYGKEGKRRNLTPFACITIVNDRPGPDEHHGCPYREFEPNRLKTALRSVGTDPNAIPVIVERAKQGNYQAACGMCFASSQPGFHATGEFGLPEYIPSHPNEYFIEARRRRFAPKIEKEEEEEEEEQQQQQQQQPFEETADDELLMAVEMAESQQRDMETPVTTPVKEMRDVKAEEEQEEKGGDNITANVDSDDKMTDDAVDTSTVQKDSVKPESVLDDPQTQNPATKAEQNQPAMKEDVKMEAS